MQKIEILGEELWQCNADEARALWKSYPADRWRIWTDDEVSAHMLDTPEQLAACILAKKEKPGKLPLKGEKKAEVALIDNPFWCATYAIICSAADECTDDCCYQPRGGI